MNDPSKGRREQAKQSVKDPEQTVQSRPDKGTEQEKIPAPAQGQPGREMPPDAAFLQKESGQKEDAQNPQAEQKVQCAPHPPAGKGQPEFSQKVVAQAQTASRCQTQEKGEGLPLGRDAHPRKSRPRKLT